LSSGAVLARIAADAPYAHAVEAEFVNVAECQRLFDEWFANMPPETLKEFQTLRDSGGSNEIWTLFE
jgi:hypothetical protein